MATKSANYNKVIIIQSLKEGKTGTRLYDDLNLLTIFTKGIVSAQLVDVENAAGLLRALTEINAQVRNGDFRPLIHLETHGADNKSGLILASGEFLSWADLKGPLSEINVATRLHLVVCVAACHGAGLVETVRTTDRAPCWALVGPLETMYPDDLLKDFTAFYDELLKTKQGGDAVKRLNRGRTGNDVLYFFTTAEWFFESVWVRYIRENCSEAMLTTRAKEMIRELRRRRAPSIPSRNSIVKKIKKEQPDCFRRSVERFFMIDLFPENRDRITLEYANILKEAKSAQRN